ncbi:MAG TPA: hypothetical protein PKN75_07455 [Bacteroidia bacterium]|nr:hypothetical protein [Bacteroidia bacterium]HNU33414.1 hypothetical protein [Bacteroidia bacterium]
MHKLLLLFAEAMWVVNSFTYYTILIYGLSVCAFAPNKKFSTLAQNAFWHVTLVVQNHQQHPMFFKQVFLARLSAAQWVHYIFFKGIAA